MNRPRKEGETYEEYRQSLAMEEFRLRNYLKGKVVWSSTKGTRRINQ